VIEYSTPNLKTFKPLPQQLEIIGDVRWGNDYSKGTHELLLSGSVGSSKSLTLAHLVITHCMTNPRARVGIGRLALPQLKATLCQKIREHLFESGVTYDYHETTGDFKIYDSEIKAVSWADQNLAKLGSMEFSAFAIEELTETKDPKPYDVILQRVNRLPHIKQPFVASATNPDSPSHWVYKKLVMSNSPKVKVYYSNTLDNPYLPASYIETLLERLDERMAQRMIYGKWVEVNDTSTVYYSYERKNNYVDKSYKVNNNLPIIITYDFNIGTGKPLSLVFMQYVPSEDTFHVFNEIIVEGQRTLDSLDEAHQRGLLNIDCFYKVRGDASGKSRDTRSIRSDYDIIEQFLANYSKDGRKIRYQIEVPRSNPPVRERHNIMNGYIRNANGKSKLFVYKDAKTVDEGLRLTKLKSGSQYLEDDSDRYQHCTTAVGYAVMFEYYKNRFNSTATSRSGSY
jgi:hypothetical protein